MGNPLLIAAGGMALLFPMMVLTFSLMLDIGMAGSGMLLLICLRFLWSPWLLFCITGCLLFFYLRRQSIVIDQEGIAFHHFLFYGRAPRYAWSEFVQIRHMTRVIEAIKKRPLEYLVFIDRYGNSFRIQILSAAQKARISGQKNRLKRYFLKMFSDENLFFAGDGHPLSLQEAIEVFYPPITPLDEEEKKKIPVFCFVGAGWSVDLTARCRQVCTLAAFILLLALVLFWLAAEFLPLDIWEYLFRKLIFWLAGALAFALAWRYLRAEKSRESAWLSSGLIAAVAVLLMMTLTTLLPAWFGKADNETFRLEENNSLQQTWRSTVFPHASFQIRSDRRYRKYDKLETELELPLYRLPGLQSISGDTLKSLHKE
ncbi:MAG: hypothetical protein LBJ59_09700 [Zoogloeaceae bacterium]|jgi:hypothetical protein|nr:hypothetical protein [Zoogloeaceae bacterium]